MPQPVIFFNGRLLPSSETFIRAQGEGLEEFTPYYVGSRLVQGLPLPPDRTLVVNQGGMQGNFKEGVFKLFGSAPQLTGQLQQLKPALVHAHFGICGALALPLAQSLNLPMIVTIYGIDITMKDEYARRASLSHWMYFRRQAALKRETKLFIAISNFIQAKMLEKGFPPEKILIHPIGVDPDTFQLDPSIQREPVVLFVARLVEKKGCEYLIRAMNKVQTLMPEVELIVIGDGPLRNSLEDLAKSSLRRYRFLGVQPPEVVRQWMNRTTVFSVPSITAESGDTEGLGVVFAEAQVMGLPVVSSASGGIPDVVAHEQTGFLAAEKDWESLANYILQLLQDSVVWQRFSLDGQERVRTKFDQRKLSKGLEDIYKAILQENK